MWINHKSVDFSNAAKMHRVTPGCASGEEEADEAGKDIEAAESNNSGNIEDSMQHEHVVHDNSGIYNIFNVYSIVTVVSQRVYCTWIVIVADTVVSVPGASIIDPCIGHECHKGSQCVPSLFGNGYSCRCQTGWQGRYCEKGNIIFLF